MPRVVLATLALNEMEWLSPLYSQHRDWPGLCGWVFVEAADRAYGRANAGRGLVTEDGLSTDGTTDFLRELARIDPRVEYVPHGWSGAENDPANGKVQARNRYMEAVDRMDPPPDYLVVVDADEFYTRAHQQLCLDLADADPTRRPCYAFRYRHPWRPPAYRDGPVFRWEVFGGFWGMDHAHFYRWSPGLRYRDYHMSPETPGGLQLNRQFGRFSELAHLGRDRRTAGPECVHTAFASALVGRQAKHRYYVARGEQAEPRRRWYVHSRAAWEVWTEGAVLPRGAQVVPWAGGVPEVFQGGEHAD